MAGLVARLPRPLWLTVWSCVFLMAGLLGYTGSSGLVSVRSCPLLTPDEGCSRFERLGYSRPIRSDEWAVDAPMERAQQLATPSFPLVNLNEGLGQLQRNSYGMPVLDWGLVFRPLLWPLFSGIRWGFGLRWFLRTVLVLSGVVGWFRVATSGARWSAAEAHQREHITALAALAVLYSSAVSWWMSTSVFEMVGFAGLGLAAAERALLAERSPARAGWWVSAGYLFTCAFFEFYPPIWAPVLWLVCATLLDRTGHDEPGIGRTFVRALPWLGTVLVAVLVAMAYYSPYLLALSHTAYPGARRATPGGESVARLLTLVWPSVNLWAPLDGLERYLGHDGKNVCDASSVEVLPCLALLAAAVIRGPIRLAMTRALNRHRWLAAAWLLLAAAQFLRLPAPFSLLTLLDRSPADRIWPVFGFGTAVLAVTVLVELPAASPGFGRVAWRESLIAALVSAAAFLLVHSRFEGSYDPNLGWRYWGPHAATALFTVVGFGLARYQAGGWFIALGWAVPLVWANVAVNPLVRSRDLFVKGPGHGVARAVLDGRPGRVLDYTTHPGAVLVGEGFATLGAVHVAPDTALFRFLAPESPGLTENVYNRYAHVRFTLPAEKSQLIQDDWFTVAISPCSPRLATLWVNHFLVSGNARLPAACADEFESRDVGTIRLWSRKVAVGPVGVARVSAPRSALDFDFGAAPQVKLTRQRDGLLLEAPLGQAPFATAVNLSLVDRVSCHGASATMLDAHLVITPSGSVPVRCEVEFMGTLGALRRLAG